MKALKGKNAEVVLGDSKGCEQMRAFLISGKDEAIIKLSNGKKYRVRGAAARNQEQVLHSP